MLYYCPQQEELQIYRTLATSDLPQVCKGGCWPWRTCAWSGTSGCVPCLVLCCPLPRVAAHSRKSSLKMPVVVVEHRWMLPLPLALGPMILRAWWHALLQEQNHPNTFSPAYDVSGCVRIQLQDALTCTLHSGPFTRATCQNQGRCSRMQECWRATEMDAPNTGD